MTQFKSFHFLWVFEKVGNNILDITSWQECQMAAVFAF